MRCNSCSQCPYSQEKGPQNNPIFPTVEPEHKQQLSDCCKRLQVLQTAVTQLLIKLQLTAEKDVLCMHVYIYTRTHKHVYIYAYAHSIIEPPHKSMRQVGKGIFTSYLIIVGKNQVLLYKNICKLAVRRRYRRSMSQIFYIKTLSSFYCPQNH